MRGRTQTVLTFAAVAAGLVVASPKGAIDPTVKNYAVGMNGYETTRVMSVGDTVAETSDASKQFQMVGIRDGLGAHRNAYGTVTVYMNHELTFNTQSEPVLGEPLNRGPIVSKLVLSSDGKTAVSAERAYDSVYLDDAYVGPAPAVGNSTRSFTRFCSGSIAGPPHGFDRWIYFANEESNSPSTFDGQGGLSVAIFDNEAHGLPFLGRFAWENTLVQKGTGERTVIMGMEDGPASQNPAESNSQIYLYVGHRQASGTALQRNGLTGGTLYVFRSKNKDRNSELDFQNGTPTGEWVAIPEAQNLSDVELEAASGAVAAMVFARPEDGAFNRRNDDEYFFVTTGGAAGAKCAGPPLFAQAQPERSDEGRYLVARLQRGRDHRDRR
jgi:Alkaline phosphatase PhoX